LNGSNNIIIICKTFNIVVRFGNKVYNLKYEGRGQIVAEGRPEDIIMCDKSYTGKYLRKYME